MDWDDINKARQRLSREQGTIIKDWGGRLPVAVIYPNTYYVGMSNLGLHAIYSLLNSYDEVVCERAFWEKSNNPRQSSVLSLESQRPLSDFAVLAFSVTYELDYFNIVQILKDSGIPLYATERDGRHPLVIAGGPCITANPMPMAPFFDCLCIGEAEAILPVMLPVLSDSIADKRSDLLKSLATLLAIYVPESNPGTPVARRWQKNLDDFPVHSIVLTRDTELGDLYLIEVERGCSRGCRFCMVSTTFHPMRYRSVDNLIEQAKLGLKYRKRIGLVGPVVSDHPKIDELLTALSQMGVGISISSLRVRPLPDILLGELAKGGARTIALAPEAGSQRLRRIINKGISEDDILKAVDKVAGCNIRQLKLYFMIGLPSETDEDMEEIVKLTVNCKSILDRHRGGSRITLNIAPFVPKAGTPFQWLPMASLSDLNYRLSLLKHGLQPLGIKIKSESPAWSEIQAVLARGDIKLAEVLANVEDNSLSGWRSAAAKSHLDVDYYAHHRWDANKKLPWSIIDAGTKQSYPEADMGRISAQNDVFRLSEKA
ncbi:radical SAM protein [Chloroflexota bacterium]